MIPMKIWKIIVADHGDRIKVEAISQDVWVSKSVIYRLLQKRRMAGMIEPSYQNRGRQPKQQLITTL